VSIKKILLKYEPKRQNVLPVFEEVSKTEGFISQKDMGDICDYFSISKTQGYAAASFFGDLKVAPVGKKIIKVCTGSTCVCSGSAAVLRELESMLGVKEGNDANPKFKIEAMSCLGLCDRGPVIKIDDQVFERVSPAEVDDIVRNYL